MQAQRDTKKKRKDHVVWVWGTHNLYINQLRSQEFRLVGSTKEVEEEVDFNASQSIGE